MTREKSNRAGKSGESSSRKLREIAQEASNRLDRVLIDGGSGEPDRGRLAAHETVPGKAALVSHVSPGVARMVANILRHMGLAVSVASTIEELDRDCQSRKWDIVFLQGASMPYPCERLVKAMLERCAGPGVKLVLLKRKGEELIPTLADIGSSASIEWPFEQERVRCEVSDLIRETQ